MITLTGVLRRFGPLGRRLAWNQEFRRGASFAGNRSRTICDLVRKYGTGRPIVELACGDGSLARSISDIAYSSYLGLDVSDEAVRIASAKAGPHQTFAVTQMEDWIPQAPIGLLVIEEAIYYLSAGQQRRLLDKTWRASPDAHVIVTVHSTEKHRASLETCRSAAAVVEEIAEGSRAYLVLQNPARAAEGAGLAKSQASERAGA